MGCAFGLGKDGRAFVRVAAPGVQNALRQRGQALAVGPGDADDRHRPAHDARADVLKARKAQRRFHRGLGHGKLIMSTLEVVVAQNRAAHDRKVCVGAEEIVREERDKVQQAAEAARVDFHGDVLSVEHDAVLVVVDVGRVLQVPVRPVEAQGDQAQVLARRVVHAPGVALVGVTELAFGIAALRRETGCRDGAGVLLGLGEVDGDVQRAVGALVDPLLILADAVAADIVRILTETVVPGGRRLRAHVVERGKSGAHLVREGRQYAHELRVEEIAGCGVVVDHAASAGVVAQSLEDLFQRSFDIAFVLRFVQLHDLQQAVIAKHPVLLQNQAGVDGVVQQCVQISSHTASSNYLYFLPNLSYPAALVNFHKN